jgi:hypothetical protein
VGDAADSMYIIISGKVGVYFPKPNYKDVKADERANTRIVSISEKEAKTLRMNAMLKEKGGWDQHDKDPNTALTLDGRGERIAKETFDMITNLLAEDTLLNKSESKENPLMHL